MGKVTGLTYEQARAKQAELKAQGKSLSTSKEMGKLENYIKTLRPENYGEDQVASAKLALKSSTQPLAGTSGASGISGSGTSSTMGTMGAPATLDLNRMYEEGMKSSEITTLEQQLAEKKTARTTAETNINDNPWYSEATRVGKQAKLNEQSQSEIKDLEDSLAQKKADVQVKLNIATQQYNIESQAYQQNLSKLNLLISSGALLNASGNDISSIALATGMSTSMVKGIQTQMQENKVKPSVITSTNDAGVVTVSVVDANTGKVISQNSLGAVGNAQTSKVDTAAAKQEAAFDSAVADGIAQLQKGENWGTVWNRIHARFPDVPSILIDSGLGTDWQQGGAYEAYAAKTKSSGQTINIVNPGK